MDVNFQRFYDPGKTTTTKNTSVQIRNSFSIDEQQLQRVSSSVKSQFSAGITVLRQALSMPGAMIAGVIAGDVGVASYRTNGFEDTSKQYAYQPLQSDGDGSISELPERVSSESADRQTWSDVSSFKLSDSSPLLARTLSSHVMQTVDHMKQFSDGLSSASFKGQRVLDKAAETVKKRLNIFFNRLSKSLPSQSGLDRLIGKRAADNVRYGAKQMATGVRNLASFIYDLGRGIVLSPRQAWKDIKYAHKVAVLAKKTNTELNAHGERLLNKQNKLILLSRLNDLKEFKAKKKIFDLLKPENQDGTSTKSNMDILHDIRQQYFDQFGAMDDKTTAAFDRLSEFMDEPGHESDVTQIITEQLFGSDTEAVLKENINDLIQYEQTHSDLPILLTESDANPLSDSVPDKSLELSSYMDQLMGDNPALIDSIFDTVAQDTDLKGIHGLDDSKYLGKALTKLGKELSLTNELQHMDTIQRGMKVADVRLNAVKSTGNALWSYGFVAGLACPPLLAVSCLGGALFLSATASKAAVNSARAEYSFEQSQSQFKILQELVETFNTETISEDQDGPHVRSVVTDLETARQTLIDLSSSLLDISDSMKYQAIIEEMDARGQYNFDGLTVNGESVTEASFKSIVGDDKDTIMSYLEQLNEAAKSYQDVQGRYLAEFEKSSIGTEYATLCADYVVAQNETVAGVTTAVFDVVNVVNWAFTFGVLGAAIGSESSGNGEFGTTVASQMDGYATGQALQAQVEGQVYADTISSFNGPWADSSALSQWGNQATQYPLFAMESMMLDKTSTSVMGGLRHAMFSQTPLGTLKAESKSLASGVIREFGSRSVGSLSEPDSQKSDSVEGPESVSDPAT